MDPTVLSFDQLHNHVTARDATNELISKIKLKIFKASSKKRNGTTFFNPYRDNSQWNAEIIEEIQSAGFKVIEKEYCGEYEYIISWQRS